MTTGGGMLLTARAEWAERARYLTTQARDDPVKVQVHTTVGFNYRLTSLAAALGCAQLKQLERAPGRQAPPPRGVRRGARGPPRRLVPGRPWAGSTWWLTAVRLDPRAFGSDRRAVHAALRARGVESHCRGRR